MPTDEASLTVEDDGLPATARTARTDVTLSLRINHHLPLPGFVRQRVIKGLVSNTVNGLRAHLKSAST